MLSTVLAVGTASVFLIAAGAFLVRYEPVIAEYWNEVYEAIVQYSDLLPDWLQPFLSVCLLLGGLSLLVKLL